MHPRMFLEGFWRPDIKYQAFVAMPFGSPFDERFTKIFRPAIETVDVTIAQRAPTDNARKLTAYRVDNSKSGDSILTEILDGIAHSLLVIADLSEVGQWLDAAQEIRATPNGNVMYEVGLALAIRQQPEVILVRDKKDKSKLLFDVSTIPCAPIDFNDTANAIEQVRSLLVDRMKAIDWRMSNKVAMTLATLTPNEIRLIRMHKNYEAFGATDQINFFRDTTFPGLLSKGILRYQSFDYNLQAPLYTWTSLGNVIRNMWPILKEPPEPKSEA